MNLNHIEKDIEHFKFYYDIKFANTKALIQKLLIKHLAELIMTNS